MSYSSGKNSKIDLAGATAGVGSEADGAAGTGAGSSIFGSGTSADFDFGSCFDFFTDFRAVSSSSTAATLLFRGVGVLALLGVLGVL